MKITASPLSPTMIRTTLKMLALAHEKSNSSLNDYANLLVASFVISLWESMEMNPEGRTIILQFSGSSPAYMELLEKEKHVVKHVREFLQRGEKEIYSLGSLQRIAHNILPDTQSKR